MYPQTTMRDQIFALTLGRVKYHGLFFVRQDPYFASAWRGRSHSPAST
ncbi:hypothetical protein ALT785_160303 [Alteromonas infernus]